MWYITDIPEVNISVTYRHTSSTIMLQHTVVCGVRALGIYHRYVCTWTTKAAVKVIAVLTGSLSISSNLDHLALGCCMSAYSIEAIWSECQRHLLVGSELFGQGAGFA